MCGIAGYLGSFSPSLLEDFQTRLAHRGPDGYGLWSNLEGQVGFAHRRLSIIDLSTAASQPMSALGGRYTIVFNGEIYNYQALAKQLLHMGYEFNQNSDTATLCPLYHTFGADFLHQLEGMFALAIYDSVEKELFIARDHAGIKPLYYAQTGQGLVFASELKTLRGVPGLNHAVDSTALAEYLTFLWTPSERTMLQGVKKLRPGHWLKAKLNKKGKLQLTIQRWWQPPQAKLSGGVPQYNYVKSPAEFLPLFDAVVAEQCTADVPVGAFLSGGLDSSALVASMVATGHRPPHTYCIGFANGRGMASEGFAEDLAYARQVAQHCNVPLTELQVDAAQILARLPTLATMLDEPTADPSPLFVQDICAHARADGLKVLLSGTGGDDIMTGYRRHLTARYREWLGPLHWPAGQALQLVSRGLKGPTQRRAQSLAWLLKLPTEAFLIEAFTTNSVPQAWQLLNVAQQQQLATVWRNDLTQAAEESHGQSLVNRLLYAEQFGFLPDHNLNYGDKASMASGVEVRVPYTDRRLLAYMANISPQTKLRGAQLKAFFKSSQRGRLPQNVIYRSKTGFGAPIRHWLNAEGEPLIHAALENPIAEELFDLDKIRQLWQQTQSGSINGALTMLGVCMAIWWLQAWRADATPKTA